MKIVIINDAEAADKGYGWKEDKKHKSITCQMVLVRVYSDGESAGQASKQNFDSSQLW